MTPPAGGEHTSVTPPAKQCFFSTTSHKQTPLKGLRMFYYVAIYKKSTTKQRAAFLEQYYVIVLSIKYIPLYI